MRIRADRARSAARVVRIMRRMADSTAASPHKLSGTGVVVALASLTGQYSQLVPASAILSAS